MSARDEACRSVKRFVTTRDIHEMAAEGTRQIFSGDDVVVTPSALELAEELGIRVAPRSTEVVAAPQAEHPQRPAVNHDGVVDAIVSVLKESGRHSPSAAEVREVAHRVLRARQ